MADSERRLTPEMLDDELEEILKQLSDEESQAIRELHDRYRLTRARSSRTLARAWERIQFEQAASARSSLQEQENEVTSRHLKSERISSVQEIKPGSPKKGSLTRLFGTLAATLVLICVVGSLILVYRANENRGTGLLGETTPGATTIVTSTPPGPTATSAPGQPAVPGIYVVDARKEQVMRLDLHTRAVIWQKAIKASGLSWNPITVVGNSVYVVFAGASDNYLSVFDARNGSLRWSRAIDQYTVPGLSGSKAYYNGMLTSPVVADGVVYLIARSGRLVALDAAHGTRLWTSHSVNTPDFMDKNGHEDCKQPVRVSNVVYGACYNTVFAVNAANGQELWTQSVSAKQVLSNPQIAAGKVFLTSYNSDEQEARMSGFAYAFNAADGTPLWKSAVDNWVLDAPAVSNGVVYFGSHNHNLYALRASDGTQIWQYDTGGVISDTPVVSDDVVYVDQQGLFSFTGSAGGTPSMQAFNAQNGQKLWEQRDAVGTPLLSSKGVLYIFGSNGIDGLNTSSGAPLWHSSEAPFGIQVIV